MQNYEAVGIVTIKSGKVELTKAQAKSRLHNLTHIDGDKESETDIYVVEKPIQFKVGEIFGADIPLNRLLASQLEQIGETDAAVDNDIDDDNEESYEAQTVAELKEELDARGIEYASADKKADLIEKLESDDAQNSDSE